MLPALISLRICLLSASLLVSRWPFPCHSPSFPLLSFFLCLPLCLQRTPKWAVVHFSRLASFPTFLSFFSARLLPVQHKGPLKKRSQGRRQQLLMASCARNTTSPKAAQALEMRCWGLEKEPEETPLMEISISQCLLSAQGERVCLSICLCNWKSAEVKSSHVVPGGATAVERPTCAHLQSRPRSLLSRVIG